MKFRNPANNYEESAHTPLSWLWVLLFGPIYWAVRGIYGHMFAHFFLALFTVGAAHFIYPFFTYVIINASYRRKGWVEV